MVPYIHKVSSYTCHVYNYIFTGKISLFVWYTLRKILTPKIRVFLHCQRVV